MTTHLRLVRQQDDGSTDTELDLLNYSDNIAAYDWIQAAYEPGTPTIETINVRIRNDVPSTIKMIDQKIRETREFLSGPDLYGVWLRAKIDAETTSQYRKALLTKLTARPGRTMIDRIIQRSNQLNEYTIAAERMPYWEDLYGVTREFTTTDCTGDQFEIATIYGDAPARIRYLKAQQYQATALNEFWLGFRTDRYGTRTNFVSEWDCGDGTAANSTTMNAGGSAVVSSATFDSDASLIDRFYIRVSDVTSNASDQRGEFQVLLLANVSSTAVCNIRLSHGVFGTSNSTWVIHDNQTQISSTTGKLYDLGTVRFPVVRGENTNAFMGGNALRIEASRTSGSGALTCTRFVLIPRSEGMIHFKGGAITNANPAYIYTHADEQMEGYWMTGSQPQEALQIDPHKWGLPVGDVRGVVAAQRSTQHSVDSDPVILTFRTFQRWRTVKNFS